MKHTSVRCRRLILGMSVEDAQSKFDSPEARSVLRVAHERYNKGVYHELQIAQRLRNKMPPERKCHISRYTKPFVKGFQAYIKSAPDDFVVTELWSPDSNQITPKIAQRETKLLQSRAKENSIITTTDHQSGDVVISPRILEEKELFRKYKGFIISALSSALDVVRENILSELLERRQSGTLVAGQQKSVVERLVGEVSEAKEKGFKSLSSSTHLLEPVEMTLTLFGKKDKDTAEAFKSNLLAFPAREEDISFSLWVAGGLVADEKLSVEFPYHIAKYILPEGNTSSSVRLPRVDVEVYFSAELYQLQKGIGRDGIRALRAFIGAVMMKQHEPIPISSSILLNASKDEKSTYNIYHPDVPEAVQIPWVSKTKMKVSTLTGVVFSTEDSEDNATTEARKEAVLLIWRAWGHLIKDLHVHGDLDFLYVSINRQQELDESAEYIREVKAAEASRDEERADSNAPALPAVVPRKGRHVASGSEHRQGKTTKTRYVPISADFVVVECLIERCGLPHNVVFEDIAETLRMMRDETLEMHRLAMMDELTALENVDVAGVVPLLYAPKIVITHAGVIDNGTHSYQRIRIRGSTLAHIEALAQSLHGGKHFTDRSVAPPPTAMLTSAGGRGTAPTPLHRQQPNLAFSATHSPHTTETRSEANRLVGNRLSANAARGNGGRFERHQERQDFDFMLVGEDEREFWREHYYRLSDLQVIAHHRVDPEDAVSGAPLSARLQEHIKIVYSKLTGGDEDEEVSTEVKGGSKRKQISKRKKKKVFDASNLPPEKVFEYLCTDTEAGCAQHDMQIGDCDGYQYRVRLRKIPTSDVPRIGPAVDSLKSKGFVNYVGTRRFATYTRMNMHPGLHLLKGEFRAAAHIIVQQFYLDAAIETERHRTGSAFPRLLSMGGAGYHLGDFMKGARRRSVAEHGTALQRVLNNALEATALLNGQSETDTRGSALATGSDLSQSHSGVSGLEDPCADAFMNVVGPNACRVIIHEFLNFLWNEVVNQRLQRYGTFAILPGDLVRAGGALAPTTGRAAELARVTKRDIAEGNYTHWDVVLPIPGAGVELPDNHTADLYVVTLKRYGLVFDPESRQWGCFTGACDGGAVGAAGSAGAFSPYRLLTSSFGQVEEELSVLTPFTEPLRARVPHFPSSQQQYDSEAAGGVGAAGLDASSLRGDLRPQEGNPLGLHIPASYRHPIVCPAPTLQWTLDKGEGGDPFKRWGASLSRQFTLTPGGEGDGSPLLMLGSSPRLSFGSRRGRHQGRPGKGLGKGLPLPATPYWVPQHNDGCLELQFTFPVGVYPSMMLRELMKMDVNTPEIVDLDRPVIDRRAKSWDSLTADQQATYRKYLAKRQRRVFSNQPRATSVALLHQQIFRSGGVRQSLIPTLRSYDSVTK